MDAHLQEEEERLREEEEQRVREEAERQRKLDEQAARQAQRLKEIEERQAVRIYGCGQIFFLSLFGAWQTHQTRLSVPVPVPENHILFAPLFFPPSSLPCALALRLLFGGWGREGLSGRAGPIGEFVCLTPVTAAQALFFEVGQRACDAGHWFGGDGRGVIDISVPLEVWSLKARCRRWLWW